MCKIRRNMQVFVYFPFSFLARNQAAFTHTLWLAAIQIHTYSGSRTNGKRLDYAPSGLCSLPAAKFYYQPRQETRKSGGNNNTHKICLPSDSNTFNKPQWWQKYWKYWKRGLKYNYKWLKINYNEVMNNSIVKYINKIL